MFRTCLTHGTVFVPLLAAGLFAPALASAQNGRSKPTVLDGTSIAAAAARANAIHVRGDLLLESRSTWPEAARLYHEAAMFREPTDPAYAWDMFDAASVDAGLRLVLDL